MHLFAYVYLLVADDDNDGHPHENVFRIYFIQPRVPVVPCKGKSKSHYMLGSWFMVQSVQLN